MPVDDRRSEAFVPIELHRRTPDEMLAYWSGKSVEWIAERTELTARAERAEAVVRLVNGLYAHAALAADGVHLLISKRELFAALDSTDPGSAK